jgi:hypothetical protein
VYVRPARLLPPSLGAGRPAAPGSANLTEPRPTPNAPGTGRWRSAPAWQTGSRDPHGPTRETFSVSGPAAVGRFLPPSCMNSVPMSKPSASGRHRNWALGHPLAVRGLHRQNHSLVFFRRPRLRRQHALDPKRVSMDKSDSTRARQPAAWAAHLEHWRLGAATTRRDAALITVRLDRPTTRPISSVGLPRLLLVGTRERSDR